MDVIPQELTVCLVRTAPDNEKDQDLDADIPQNFHWCILRSNGRHSSALFFFTSEAKANTYFTDASTPLVCSPVMPRAFGLELIKWARGDYHGHLTPSNPQPTKPVLACEPDLPDTPAVSQNEQDMADDMNRRLNPNKPSKAVGQMRVDFSKSSCLRSVWV